MILGSVTIDADAVHTHRDSYLLPSLTVVSVRRPLLPGGILFAAGFGAFAFAFGDLLHPPEIQGIAGGCVAAMAVGLSAGQLKLLSRDLRGSELAGMIWGSYWHLNRIRREVAGAMRQHSRKQPS